MTIVPKFVGEAVARLSRRLRLVAASTGAIIAVLTRISGIALAASGVAHLVAPRPFVAISKPFFPEDTEKWVAINGGSEAVIGLALVDKRTRTVGIIGLLTYGVYLGDRIIGFALARLKA